MTTFEAYRIYSRRWSQEVIFYVKHMFDLRSSSVTTRQSSSELDSALAKLYFFLRQKSVHSCADISIYSRRNPNALLAWMILYSVRSLLPKSENSFYLRNAKLFYLEDECGTSWNAWPNQAMAHKRCTTFNAFIPFADSFFIVLSSLNDYFCS